LGAYGDGPEVETRPTSIAGVGGTLARVFQASLGQGDADLEAPGLAPFPTPFAGSAATLFQNVRIFDGKSAVLSSPSNVLVKGNIIERISGSPITIDTNTNVRVVAADGRVLMPGLIDAHWHALQRLPTALMRSGCARENS
jgi:hypothetical protein